MKNEKLKMVPMNLYLPNTFKEWLEVESIKTGMTQTSLIVLALKTYMDQQRTIDLLPELLEALENLKKIGMDTEELEKIIGFKKSRKKNNTSI